MFAIESPTARDRCRTAALVETYRDLELGYVDATTIALAERLEDARIAPVDRRDVSAVRPRHVERFALVP